VGKQNGVQLGCVGARTSERFADVSRRDPLFRDASPIGGHARACMVSDFYDAAGIENPRTNRPGTGAVLAGVTEPTRAAQAR